MWRGRRWNILRSFSSLPRLNWIFTLYGWHFDTNNIVLIFFKNFFLYVNWHFTQLAHHFLKLILLLLTFLLFCNKHDWLYYNIVHIYDCGLHCWSAIFSYNGRKFFCRTRTNGRLVTADPIELVHTSIICLPFQLNWHSFLSFSLSLLFLNTATALRVVGSPSIPFNSPHFASKT